MPLAGPICRAPGVDGAGRQTSRWPAELTDAHAAQIRVHGAINAATAGAVPGAPTGLSATLNGATTIDLSWTAPTSIGSSAITGYRIEISSDGGAAFTDLVANTGNPDTTYAHIGVAAGITLHYRVSAINPAGAGTVSNAANAAAALVSNVGQTTFGSERLGATYDIAQEFVTGANSGGYTLSSLEVRLRNVGEVTNNYPTVKVMSGSANGTQIAALTAPSTAGSSGDGNYTYTAAASVTLAGGTSYWVVLEASSSGVTVTDSSAEDATSASGWEIADNYQRRDASSTAGYSSATAGYAAQIRVHGVSSAATGATAPGAPTSLSATGSGATRIDLSWTAPTSNGGAVITGYKIEVSADAGATFTDLVANTHSTNTTYAHTGLVAGATRRYRVSAINSVGTGTASNVANAATALVSNVGQASAAASTALNTYDIAQEFVTGDNSAGYTLSGIDVRLVSVGAVTTNYPTLKVMSGSATGTEVAALTAPSTAGGSVRANYAYTAPANVTLASGTSYWVVYEGSSSGVVRTASSSEDATSASGWAIADKYQTRSASSTAAFADASISAAAQIRVHGAVNGDTGATAPGAPTSLSATASGTSRIDLSWTAPASDGGAVITGYKIESSSDGGATFTDLVANTHSINTTHAHTGLVGGASRHYRVSAINVVGAGVASNVANATTALVSNVDQTSAGGRGLASNDVAQEFVTGDNGGGYTLSSIEVRLYRVGAVTTNYPTAKVVSGSATGTEVAELTAPTTTGTDPHTNYTYTAPANVTLAGGTSYWVVYEGSSSVVATTSSSAEDATSASGWEIADSYQRRGASSTARFFDVSGFAAQIRVHGTVNAATTATAPGAPTGLSATLNGATTIDLEWTASVSSGSHAVTGHRIEVSSDGGATFTDLVADTGNSNTTYADVGVANATTRHYRVSAINPVGVGAASNVADATTALVSNVGQTSRGGPVLSSLDVAQEFVTGDRDGGRRIDGPVDGRQH